MKDNVLGTVKKTEFRRVDMHKKSKKGSLGVSGRRGLNDIKSGDWGDRAAGTYHLLYMYAHNMRTAHFRVRTCY